MTVWCECEECYYNVDGECDKDYITVSNQDCTAAGFLPLCKDYNEVDG